jgi:hypothetical protein
LCARQPAAARTLSFQSNRFRRPPSEQGGGDLDQRATVERSVVRCHRQASPLHIGDNAHGRLTLEVEPREECRRVQRIAFDPRNVGRPPGMPDLSLQPGSDQRYRIVQFLHASIDCIVRDAEGTRQRNHPT